MHTHAACFRRRPCPKPYLIQVGTDRAIPTSVATALSKEIKDFIEEEAPLMLLMSSPGIKKRHWDQIVKISGIPLSYEQDFVLRDLLDAGLQNYCAEIEEARVFPLLLRAQMFSVCCGRKPTACERHCFVLFLIFTCLFRNFLSQARNPCTCSVEKKVYVTNV